MKKSIEARSSIMAAAYELLSQKGYEAVTMKEIARGAGVAPGLIHYYFASKDQLLVEVLREAGDRYVKQMQQLTATSTTDHSIQAAFAQPRQRTEQEPEWYRLRSELFALSLRNPLFQTEMKQLLASGRQCISEAIKSLAQGSLNGNSEAIASVLLACFDGLAVQKLSDPDFDLDGAYEVLIKMFESQL